MIQSALKILCRQCSELTTANIISSTSVGSRPGKGVQRVVNLLVREGQAHFAVGRHERTPAFGPHRDVD